MRKQAAFVVGPAVIPAKAGIQYAAASRLIIGSSAILDRPPSRAMTRRPAIASRTFACAPMRKQAAFLVGPAVIPAKAGIQYAAALNQSSAPLQLLDRPPSRALTRRPAIAAP